MNKSLAFHRPIDTNAPAVCCVCGHRFEGTDGEIIRLDLAAMLLAFHRDPCAGVLLEQLKPYVGQA